MIHDILLFPPQLAMGSESGSDSNGDEVNGGGLDVNVDPSLSLSIESKDNLEMTVTKTGIDVFTKLGAVRKDLFFLSRQYFVKLTLFL